MSAPVQTQHLLRKTHRSALVVRVPDSPQIEELKSGLTNKEKTWMPHINLAYPFHPYDCATQPNTAQMLRRLCLNTPSFTVRLSRLGRFEQRSGRHLIYAAPEDESPFLRVQEALADMFPDCADVSHYAVGYKPHMILGAVPSQKSGSFSFESVSAQWRPITFRVDAISWAMRQEKGPFAIGETFDLLTSH
jgi:2'-5' RNA ligase